VTLAPETARAFALYLRARRQHKLADSDWVWLGTRSRGRFGNTGIRMMLIRRAEEAGYGKARPHQFRHILSALFRGRDCHHRRASGPAACADRGLFLAAACCGTT
jgi:integrase